MWRKIAILWAIIYVAVAVLIGRSYLQLRSQVFKPPTAVITPENAHRLAVLSETTGDWGSPDILTHDFLYYLELDRIQVVDVRTGRQQGAILYREQGLSLSRLFWAPFCLVSDYGVRRYSTDPRYILVGYRQVPRCNMSGQSSPDTYLIWDTQTLSRRDVAVSPMYSVVAYLPHTETMLAMDSARALITYPLDGGQIQTLDAGPIDWRFFLVGDSVYYQLNVTNELRRLNADLSTQSIASDLGSILDISANGRFIGFDDGHVQGIYDAVTHDEWTFAMSGQTANWYGNIEMSPDSQRVVLSGPDGAVTLFATEGGVPEATISPADGAGSWALAYSVRGDMIFGTRGQHFKAWDLAGNELVYVPLKLAYNPLLIDPNGKFIIVGLGTIVGIG